MPNPHEPPADAAPALVLGRRYQLLSRVGAGGFGRVWLAHDNLLGVDVAVKEVQVPPGATAEETSERVERAAREARNAALLRDHPNIVTVHDVVIERGAPWIVMQYLPGRSLAQEIELRGRIPVSSATEIAACVLSALEACHAAAIVHRDVKPANIMLGPDGSVTLTDFGIARQAEQSPMTAQDTVIGSVEYLAPERARGLPATPASDLYSLGVTLYHAVEGASPFKRRSGTATLSAVLLDELPAPSRAGALAPLITALTRKDPDARPSVEQARAMLSGEVSLPTVPQEAEQQPDRRGGKPVRRLFLLSAAAAACAGAAAGGVIAALSESHDSVSGHGNGPNAIDSGTSAPLAAVSDIPVAGNTPVEMMTSQVPVGGGVVVSGSNIVVTQPSAGTYRAFSASCTHMGCQVAQVSGNKITCPCHGSVFSAVDGSVIQGPAAHGLPGHRVYVSGDTIVVS